jgi:hypothetical protein
MPEPWVNVNQTVHRVPNMIELAPQLLGPLVVAGRPVVAIEAPRNEIRGLNQAARPRIREEGNVDEVRELADTAGNLPP